MKTEQTGADQAAREPEPELKFKRDSVLGYVVFLDGKEIGSVKKFSRSVRARRMIKINGWRATTADGTKLYEHPGGTANTREAAVQKLIERVS